MGKNIWIVNHYAIPPYLPGGTRHYDLSKRLVELGYSVTIFSSSFHYQKLRDFKTYKDQQYFIKEQLDGVEFIWFKTRSYTKNNYKRVLNMLSFVHQFKKFINNKQYSNSPDIIIGSSVHLFAVSAAAKAASKLNARFYMEVRDIWPQTLIDLGVSKWHPLVQWLGRIERKMYKKAEKIIVLLPRAKEHILKFGIPAQKITYIPNGVDIKPYSENDLPCNENKIFTIVYAGVIGLANNLIIAVETAKLFQDKGEPIHFKIVGEGQEKKKLMNLANKYKLNNIEFVGAIPKAEIKSVLQSANALYFNLIDSPVFKYGLSSNKLFDYLASKKPIIFSCKAGNNPVEEAKAGLTIEPNSSESLYKAIKKLKSYSKDELIQMGENGYNFIKEHHSMEVLTKDLVSVLE
ncbi:glycosyltransferase family 4 protein [Compostibacter hankyongensis]|uniref:Glycosyltransferase family 4 protein n=1 Tax=Compostibacter hankyongensis TaxID=1007089 RepID=A0ABP8FV12_9BACT